MSPVATDTLVGNAYRVMRPPNTQAYGSHLDNEALTDDSQRARTRGQ